MFGINKKNTQKSTNDKKKVAKPTKDTKKQLTTNQSAIPDLICKSFVDGCLVLGCVHDITNSELIVSLPGIGNFGFIKLNNVSKVYTELLRTGADHITSLSGMYSKGNLVRCKVLSYTNKKLYLTIAPEEVNSNLRFENLEDKMIISGAVKSKEDHGYTIDLGVDDLTGFFKTSDLNLPLGQCLLFKIKSKKSTRTIHLEICDNKNESSFYTLEKKYNFDTYLPGAKILCTVEKTSKNGLQAVISKDLFAYIHVNHLPVAKRDVFLSAKKKDKSLEVLEKKENKNEYTNGDKVTGTIIFLNPYSKVVYLSLLPHLTDSTKSAKISKMFLNDSDNLKLGQVVKNAIVTIHTYKGIYVKFKGASSKDVLGFIPKRHLFERIADQEVEENESDDDGGNEEKKKKKDAKNMTREDIESSFPLKSQIDARIYNFSLIEDVIMLSHRKSVIESPYMFYDELKIGQVVKCKVRGINANGGVNVYLSEFLNGFVPKIHTGDVPLKDTLIARKIKKGGELKCRVIQLDPEEKRCVLTAKKSLIKSDLPLIDSFDNLKLGMETYGTVVSIQQYGLLLSFLNDLKGLLPRQQISTSEVVKSETYDLKEIYYVGQLIRCKVFKYDRERKQVKLSLIMKDKNQVESAELEAKKSTSVVENMDFGPEYEIGDLIESATILQVNDANQYFRLKLPHGQKNGLIYKNHLSDMDCLNDLLFEYYKREMKMTNLMITQYSSSDKAKLENINKNNQSHYMTLKSTVIAEYTKTPKENINKSFSDLISNEWHNGWVRKILPNGLLVEMPHNLIGFTSNQDVSYLNELKSSVTNGLSIGQSILIKIGKLFQEKSQFIVSVRTRQSLMQTSDKEVDFMMNLFKSCFINTNKILTRFLSGEKSSSSVNPISLANRTTWENAASKVKVGSVVEVVVKSFNMVTRQIECAFVSDLNEANGYKSTLAGVAFADCDEEAYKKYKQGAKFEALVLAFDPLAKVFCLTVDSKQIKVYKKNFDKNFRAHSAHKQNQVIKAEIMYVSQWFCIVGLKQHALGHIAIMPLFKNDFTQLNTCQENAESKFDVAVETKIKKQQLLKVSSASLAKIEDTADASKSNKDDKHFAYYNVGQVGKVCVKDCGSDDNLDYSIVVHDLTTLKQNRKSLLRQLAILNENHTIQVDDSSNKRKLSENDEPILIKKKLNLDKSEKANNKRKLTEINGNKDSIEIVTDIKKTNKKQKPELDSEKISGIGSGVEYPWEVTDFDQFNKILSTLNTANGKNESDDDDNSDTENIKKKTKKTKKTNKEFINDKNLCEIEEKAFDPNRSPETIEDYERLLIASPNSSFLWIKYMAFHLQMGETEKSRDVAHKALKTIAYQDESERMNVWVALLNMENLYGTQANIDDSFNRANQNCDSFKIHSHMAEIYARSGKVQEAEDIFMRMTRKFANRQDVWIKYAIFHYKNSNCELARKLLIRCFGSLDKKEHVEMVNKFAQLEFKYGDVERAKTMYDSLLFTYSNRTDIWSVYIDMLVKHEKIEDARNVFNRIVGLGLTVKRMKFIFKKFLDFEKIHGDEDLIEKVKEVASKYVESNNSMKLEQSENTNNNKSQEIEASLKKNLKI